MTGSKNSTDHTKKTGVISHVSKEEESHLGLFIACGLGLLATQTAIIRSWALFDDISYGPSPSNRDRKKKTELQQWVQAGSNALRRDTIDLMPLLGARAIYLNRIKK